MKKLPVPPPLPGDEEDLLIRSVAGGLLVQSRDRSTELAEDLDEQSRHQTQADARRTGRDALRLARR